MIYTVFVAICLSATPAKSCRQSTALDWIVAPQAPTSLSACMRHGLHYAAASRLVRDGSYAKVFCAPKLAPARAGAHEIEGSGGGAASIREGAAVRQARAPDA